MFTLSGIVAVLWLKVQGLSLQIEAERVAANTKIHEMNLRLVDLETEPDPEPPSKEDKDIMSSANSWLSQMAAAERGEGVRT